MQQNKNEPVNVAEFSHKGSLASLVNKAKTYNLINDKLVPLLPPSLATIRLSTIDEKTATFVACDQSVAFKARQQEKLVLETLQKLDDLSHINKINVKVDSK